MRLQKALAQMIGIVLILLLSVGCSASAIQPTPVPPTATPTPPPTLTPTTVSTEKNRAGLTNEEVATLSSLEQVDDYPLYTMRY